MKIPKSSNNEYQCYYYKENIYYKVWEAISPETGRKVIGYDKPTPKELNYNEFQALSYNPELRQSLGEKDDKWHVSVKDTLFPECPPFLLRISSPTKTAWYAEFDSLTEAVVVANKIVNFKWAGEFLAFINDENCPLESN